MKNTQIGNWNFELKQVFARKTINHGKPYTASTVITITNGTPNIELMINKSDDEFCKQDIKDIKEFLTSLGFKNAKFTRSKKQLIENKQ